MAKEIDTKEENPVSDPSGKVKKDQKKKPLQSSFLNMVLVLVLVGVISGGLVGLTYENTKDPIEENQKLKQRRALSDTLGSFNNDPLEESIDGLYETKIFTARTDSEIIGYAVQVTSPLGYGGDMEAMVGFDRNKSITGVSVIKHSETPGLGTNVLKEKFWSQYLGKSVEDGDVLLSSDGGDVDAISGVTFSSRALTDAVNKAVDSLRQGVQ